MKIGDRVRDKGTEFVGTVVQLDPATGTATRVLIQADSAPTGKVGDPPPEKMWQTIDGVELVDLEGKRVSGKAGQQLDAPVGKGAADVTSGGKKPAAGATAN